MQLNTLEKLDAAILTMPNVIRDIDLSSWQMQELGHQVKSSMEYAEDVANLIFCKQEDQTASKLKLEATDGKFEFRTHEMTCWTGFKGHGKSIFISQVFVDFMLHGEKVFIISPEFTPVRVLERMVYQQCRTKQVSEEMLVDFFNWSQHLAFLYGKQTSLKPDDVVALCRYAHEKHGIKHILIDSLMKCGIPSDDYTKQKTFVDRLQNIAHCFGPHIHLVAHARKQDQSDDKPPRLHDIKGASEIADMVENVCVVWRNKQKEKDQNPKQELPDAMFIVEAQRNADGWIGSVPLWFDQSSVQFTDKQLMRF